MATEVEVHVNVHVHDGIGLIQLNRPEKMNAIGALTRQQLGDAIKQAERDDAVRVLVLTGSGRAFCSGADVIEMAQGAGMRTPEGSEEHTSQLQSHLNIVFRLLLEPKNIPMYLLTTAIPTYSPL